MTTINFLSYNIHKGFSAGNNEFILNYLRDAIRELNSDIVCLQEVVGEHILHQESIDDWHNGGQFEFLADSIWHHYAYGKNAIYQHGHHGNAILSKYPFSFWENIDISLWHFSQRGILHGRIGENLHILCIHFGFLPIEQRYQLNRLKQIITDKIPSEAALIVAGDFNDWHHLINHSLTRDLQLSEALSDKTKRAPATFPSRFPVLAMDRIYYRNLTLKHARPLARNHWQDLSDHCPVIAQFSLPFDLSSLAP